MCSHKMAATLYDLLKAECESHVKSNLQQFVWYPLWFVFWFLPLELISVFHSITALFNIIWTVKFKAQLTIAFFRYGQANVQRLLPAFDFCRTCSNEIVEHSSKSKTVLSGSQKLGRAAEIWFSVAKNMFASWVLSFRVCMFLKGIVSNVLYMEVFLCPPKRDATVYMYVVHDRVTPQDHNCQTYSRRREALWSEVSCLRTQHNAPG